jgi:hypothetical protein
MAGGELAIHPETIILTLPKNTELYNFMFA